MLLEFNIKNFLSFNEEIELSFLPSDKVTGRKSKLLHLADKQAIFTNMLITGLSNSGKSNIFKALSYLTNRVLFKTNIEPEVFKHNASNKWIYTDFKLTFRLNDIKYLYEVSFSKQNIVTEKLSDISKEEAVVLFNRNENNIDWSMYPTKETYISHELYLTDLFEHITGLESFFKDINTNYFLHIDDYTESQIHLVNKLLKWFDIKNMRLIKDGNMTFVEEDGQRNWDISTSIKQFLCILHGLLVAKERKAFLYVDAPLSFDITLQEAMLKMAECLETQLILVTNSNQLMDYLDADQIFICQKASDKSTELFCLSDFDVVGINQKPLRRWHEAGKFSDVRYIYPEKIANTIDNYINNINETTL
jgi:hypothetical protein